MAVVAPDQPMESSDVVYDKSHFAVSDTGRRPQIDIISGDNSNGVVHPIIRYGFSLDLLKHALELDIEFEIYMTFTSDTIKFSSDSSAWRFSISASDAVQNIENLNSQLLTFDKTGQFIQNVFMAFKGTTAGSNATFVLDVRPSIVWPKDMRGATHTVVGLLTISIAAITYTARLEPVRRSLGGWIPYRYRDCEERKLPIWKRLTP